MFGIAHVRIFLAQFLTTLMPEHVAQFGLPPYPLVIVVPWSDVVAVAVRYARRRADQQERRRLRLLLAHIQCKFADENVVIACLQRLGLKEFHENIVKIHSESQNDVKKIFAAFAFLDGRCRRSERRAACAQEGERDSHEKWEIDFIRYSRLFILGT